MLHLRRCLLATFGVLISFVVLNLAGLAEAAAPQGKPNVILILADDKYEFSM